MNANVCKLVALGSKEPFLYPLLIKNLKYEKLSFLHLCPNAINLLLAAGYYLGCVSVSMYNAYAYCGVGALKGLEGSLAKWD